MENHCLNAELSDGYLFFALILTCLAFTLPYAILLMTGYLNTLPRELDEAVLIDSWSALWRIIVPLSVPGIIATGVYTFLLAWNEFLFALTLTKSMDMQTAPIGFAFAGAVQIAAIGRRTFAARTRTG